MLLIDKRSESAEDTAQMIKEVDGEASVFAADITVEADCQAIVETCVARYGRVDILHNNVGIAAGDADTVDVTEANWERLMDINLKGMFLTIKHVLPVMRSQGSGESLSISPRQRHSAHDRPCSLTKPARPQSMR